MPESAFSDAYYEAEERAGMREDGNDGATGPNGQTSGRFRLLTDEDLENQPPRIDLVSDLLPAGAFGALIGRLPRSRQPWRST
jgi:hypothetical protein